MIHQRNISQEYIFYQRARLKFTESADIAYDDSLKVYGYGSVAGVAIDTFNDTIAPGVTSLSYGSAVTITFKTNNYVQKKGFKVQFSDGR